jgi:hypothetical protein
MRAKEATVTKRLSAAIFGLGLMLLLVGCAALTLDHTWQDPTYGGTTFKKVLVIGLVSDPQVRRTFEDAFVGALKNRGMDGVTSYTLIPNVDAVKRAAVVEAVRTAGADSVLVTRLVRSETRRAAVSQPMWSMDSMDMVYQYGPGPQTTLEQSYQISVLETDLYDTKTAKIVWSGQSSSFPNANIGVATRELAARVISALKDGKLL